MKSKRFFKGLIFINLLGLIFSFQTPITHSEDYYECPANSHWGGDQCYCDSGYVSTDGSNCISEASICAPYGPSHLVGTDCVCNDGYAILEGSSKCQSLSAACAKYNAVWNAGIGDCSCPSGTHLNDSTGMCVSDAPKTTTPTTTTPTTTNTATTSPTTTATTTPKTTTTTTQPTTPSATTSTEPVSAGVNTSESPFEAVDQLMADNYAKLDTQTQTVIAENQTIIPQIVEETFVPNTDIYNTLSADISFKEPITESLATLPKAEQNLAKQQLAVLETFNDGSNEVQLTGQSVIKKIHETFVDENYEKQMSEWTVAARQAESSKKLKAEVDAKKYEDDLEMERRLKMQIAALEKINGYNHQRCLESTKKLKFETMDKDYKAYFNNKSAEDMFEEASEGTAFVAAVANANGASKQIKELKDELKRKYPSGWKSQYLDIPAKPNREKISQTEENIFKVFEKLRKQK